MIKVKIDDMIEQFLEVGDTLIIPGPNPKFIGRWELIHYTSDQAFFEDGTRTMIVTASGALIGSKFTKR